MLQRVTPAGLARPSTRLHRMCAGTVGSIEDSEAIVDDLMDPDSIDYE